MGISIDQVRELRRRTGAGVLDAKNALESTSGDLDAAIQVLREKGLATAAKKATREASEGRVLSYIHGDPGRIGVLLEINCETDFVARTAAFQDLATNVAMQVAAADPQYIDDEDVPEDVLAHERQTARSQMAGENKPPEILDKIVQGKVDKWLDGVVLLRQPYIRDESITVRELVQHAIAELGENIVVRRFARFALGEQS
jgi:elongation factor Ts